MRRITRAGVAFLIMLCLIGNLTACGSGTNDDVLSETTAAVTNAAKDDVLSEMTAVVTGSTIKRYDDDGNMLYESVWECDENGNELSYRSVYYNAGGEISATFEKRYDGNGNQTEEKRIDTNFSHETWAYDANGQEIENIRYDENGNIEGMKDYEYDDDGNLIEEIDYDEYGSCERRVKIEYDADGNETQWECYDKYGECIIKRIHSYDEHGNLILYAESRNGTSGEIMECERDERGNVIKSVYYDGDGNITGIREYEYDEMDREIKCVRYEEDGTVGYWNEHEYDEWGRETKFKSYNSTGNFEYCISESRYDENGREIYSSHETNDIITNKQEKEYDENGNIIKEIRTDYDNNTGQQRYQTIDEYTYDDNGNRIEYANNRYEEEESYSFHWKKEYDEDGRETAFYLYDNEEEASYQSVYGYDENGRLINYTGYDKDGNVLVKRETEYDASGKVMRKNEYDAENTLIRYFENEYDDFGNMTRQVMYENGILKAEKQTNYAYRYIENMNAEEAEYMDDNMAPREIFTRFLSGEEKVRLYKRTPEYTFLDMTGDGIEELIIFCSGDPEKLCVIQCSHGMLKVIQDLDGRFDAFLVKHNGRIGICCDYGIQSGMDRHYYYFMDEERTKEIFAADNERYDESCEDFKHFYSMSDSDSFEECAITKGEYYDIMSGMTEMADIDWQKLEESETSPEAISAPETYEDYRKLSDAYLQKDDVLQALAVLDEGIEKLGSGNFGMEAHDVDLLSQRKAYVLAGTVAVGAGSTTNRYDDDGNMYRSDISEYDKNGNVLSYRSVDYDSAGEVHGTQEYQYDGNGNQIEYQYTVYDDDGNGSIFSHVTWEYDENGNLTEYLYYNRDGNIGEKIVYEYDASGNEIRYEEYDKDGESVWKMLHSYDEYGNLILFVEYRDGNLKNKSEREFDGKNQERKAIFYDGDGKITKVTKNEYDENGRLVKWLDYNASGGFKEETAYEYHENGKLAKRVEYCHYDDGSVNRVIWKEYDENGNEVYSSYEMNGIVIIKSETKYDGEGNIIRKIQKNYDEDTGKEKAEQIYEYTYDEKKNRITYDYACYKGGKKTNCFLWKREYNENGRETAFYLYDNEESASYQSVSGYDENGRLINYTGYDKDGNVLVKRETEYDASGKAIQKNEYDADGNLIRYFENEYDDFGSITRQVMYEDGILKFEKQTSYTYHYIGNIDTEAAEYMDIDMTPEEYNRKQREIFTRFLNGEEKVRFYGNESDAKDGIVVEDTITDIVNRGYNGGTWTYTFLDMTGDGIEELLIRCGDRRRICVVQCCYGILKVVGDIPRDSEERYGNVYLVRYSRGTGIYRDCSTKNYDKWDEYYFWDEKGKKGIFINEHDYYDKSVGDWQLSHYMTDIDGFEECAITKGEYYDIISGMTEMTNIDWQKLEEPIYGND